MSVVTAVTLIYRPNFSDPAKEINDWLKLHDFMPLESISRFYGGNKHPQCRVLGAGYNYFTVEEEFIEFIQNISWDSPENMVLIIQPEEGSTKVYRPKGFESTKPTITYIGWLLEFCAGCGTLLHKAFCWDPEEQKIKTCPNCGQDVDGPANRLQGKFDHEDAQRLFKALGVDK